MKATPVIVVAGVLLVATTVCVATSDSNDWSAAQLTELRSLSLSELEPLPHDPTNRVAYDPVAAQFGERLFFDTRLSANGKVACGTCHQRDRHFQDGTALAQGVFGPLPDLSNGERDAATAVFVNIGKAIAAYERRIEFAPSRFDRYVDAVVAHEPANGILTRDEIAGLKLFVGKARCTQCHNGPLLTNNEFHNTGVPRRAGLPNDDGRMSGASAVLKDEFNYKSRWSDSPASCQELEYLVVDDHTLQRAYKVPSLRNVAERAPFMNAGQYATLAEVLDHYNRAPAAPDGHTELKPLKFKPNDLRQLEAFLRTLSAPLIVNGKAVEGTR